MSSRVFTIYMDETGFTGEDLMSESQPVFVHVSTDLTDEEARNLFDRYFSGVRVRELKHSKLSRRPSHQRKILDFLQGVKSSPQRFTSCVCHKRFLLLTYLVDLWVEPAMRKYGIDLYKDGANLGLANMAYYCLKSFQSDAYLSDILIRFQHMMRKRTLLSYNVFWDKLYRDFHTLDKNTNDILVFFLGGERELGFPHLRSLPNRSIDPIFTTAHSTVGHWRKHKDQPLKLVHDQSSNFAKDKELWDLMTSPDMDRATIGIPGREMRFPLNVAETKFTASKEHLQLQYCDLLAGACATRARRVLGFRHGDVYSAGLEAVGLDDFSIVTIWPQPAVTPEELGMKGWSSQLVDYTAEQAAKVARKRSGQPMEK